MTWPLRHKALENWNYSYEHWGSPGKWHVKNNKVFFKTLEGALGGGEQKEGQNVSHSHPLSLFQKELLLWFSQGAVRLVYVWNSLPLSPPSSHLPLNTHLLSSLPGTFPSHLTPSHPTVAMVTDYPWLGFIFHLSFNFSARGKCSFPSFANIVEFSSRWETFPHVKGWRSLVHHQLLVSLLHWSPHKKSLVLLDHGSEEPSAAHQPSIWMFFPLSSMVRHRGPLPPPAFLLPPLPPACTGPRAPHLSLPPQPGRHTHSSSQNGHLACGGRGRWCQPCIPQAFIYCASAVCQVLCHRESPAFMKHSFYWGRQTTHR